MISKSVFTNFEKAINIIIHYLNASFNHPSFTLTTSNQTPASIEFVLLKISFIRNHLFDQPLSLLSKKFTSHSTIDLNKEKE